MKTKICSKCNIEKLLTEMVKNKNSKDGYENTCKICRTVYRKVNSDILKQYQSNYYTNNKVVIKEIVKKYYSINHVKIKQKQKLYRDNKIHDKEAIKIYNKEYRKINKIILKEKDNKRKKERKQHDPLFKLVCNLRNMTYKSIKRNGHNKKSTTADILGCSFDEFKTYLESKFESWMTWDNYGNPKDGILELNKTWDIDHIEPLYPTGVIRTEIDIVKLNHYTNLQPLCSYVNRLTKINK